MAVRAGAGFAVGSVHGCERTFAEHFLRSSALPAALPHWILQALRCRHSSMPPMLLVLRRAALRWSSLRLRALRRCGRSSLRAGALLGTMTLRSSSLACCILTVKEWYMQKAFDATRLSRHVRHKVPRDDAAQTQGAGDDARSRRPAPPGRPAHAARGPCTTSAVGKGQCAHNVRSIIVYMKV